MFSETIDINPFCSQKADEIFTNIITNRTAILGDCSIISTLRALLFSRLNEQNFVLLYDLISYPATQNEFDHDLELSLTNGKTFENERACPCDKNILEIYNIACKTADESTVYSYIINNDHVRSLRSQNSGWQELVDIEKFIEKYSRLHILINKEKNLAKIFVVNCSKPIIHFISSLIPRYIPGLLDTSKMSEDEIDLLKALSGNDKVKVCDIYEKIYRASGVEATWTIRKLGKMFTKSYERQISNLEISIANWYSSLSSLERQYSEYLQNIREANLKITGLKTCSSEESPLVKTLLDYFNVCKNIHLVDVSNDYATIEVEGHLTNFDDEAYDSIISGFSYTGRILDPATKDLLDNIFKTKRLKVRMWSKFDLNFELGTVRVSSSFTSGARVKEDRIANPHHYKHHCLGDYNSYIAKSLRDGDIEEALDGCIAAVNSVNLHESTMTFYPFVSWILESKEHIIEDTQTGELISPVQYINKKREQ